MYPEEMVQPMREELTSVGFREMRTAEEVDAVLAPAKGTVLVAVNSICGCAAGKARPGIALALSHHVRPDVLATVFAGQEMLYEMVTGRPPFGGSSQVRLARTSICPSAVARSGSIFRTRPSSSMMTAGRLPSEELARYDSSPAFDMP